MLRTIESSVNRYVEFRRLEKTWRENNFLARELLARELVDHNDPRVIVMQWREKFSPCSFRFVEEVEMVVEHRGFSHNLESVRPISNSYFMGVEILDGFGLQTRLEAQWPPAFRHKPIWSQCNKARMLNLGIRVTDNGTATEESLRNARVLFFESTPDNVTLSMERFHPGSDIAFDADGRIIDPLLSADCFYLMRERLTKSRIYPGSKFEIYFQGDGVCAVSVVDNGPSPICAGKGELFFASALKAEELTDLCLGNHNLEHTVGAILNCHTCGHAIAGSPGRLPLPGVTLASDYGGIKELTLTMRHQNIHLLRGDKRWTLFWTGTHLVVQEMRD